MRLYLSSYKYGNHPEVMFRLLRSEKKKVAVITNAADPFPEESIIERFNEDVKYFAKHDLKAERLDLRNYFGKQKELANKVDEYALIWVRGGNVFVLRQAMAQSGFDLIIKQKLKEDSIVYGGYSAGCCVLSPSLEGFDIVDDSSLVEKTYGLPADYSALGVLDYHFEPHFESDHPESADISKEVEKLKRRKIPYRTLHDGEVIVVDGDKEELIG